MRMCAQCSETRNFLQIILHSVTVPRLLSWNSILEQSTEFMQSDQLKWKRICHWYDTKTHHFVSLLSSSVSRLQGPEGSSSTTRCFFFPSPIPQVRESQSEGMGMRLYTNENETHYHETVPQSLLCCHTQT